MGKRGLFLASFSATFLVASLAAAIVLAQRGFLDQPADPQNPFDSTIRDNTRQMIDEGRQTFRFDTFGSEAFWGDLLQLHQGLQGQAAGGVGPGVSPRTALAVGLKVDSEAIPAPVVAARKSSLNCL